MNLTSRLRLLKNGGAPYLGSCFPSRTLLTNSTENKGHSLLIQKYTSSSKILCAEIFGSFNFNTRNLADKFDLNLGD